MSQLNDKVAMRHMDIYMEQEEKYTEAVMSDTENLNSKLHSEIASRFHFDLSTPPLKWGPWMYYRRVEDGKQYPILCRRLARLNEEFISHKSPSSGFDFTSGKRIEQKLLDYNQEAEKYGGYSYEELSEVSPDHHYLAYTMYDKDNDYFKLSVRDMNLGTLCSKPQAERVTNIAWAKDGKTLLYVVADHKKRPYRIYCSMIESNEKDVLLYEELEDNVHVKIRHTKDFQHVVVYRFSTSTSKVFLINAADPLSSMTLIWECAGQAHCVVEHHQGFLYLFTNAKKNGQHIDHHYLLQSPVDTSLGPRTWQNVFADDPKLVIEDVDLCHSHLVLIVRDDHKYRLCSVYIPLPSEKLPVYLRELNPQLLPLPDDVCQISPGPNYDYHSSIMRFTVSSPVMPDAVVDYDLSNGKWNIVQQQNLLHERTRVLYGSMTSAVGGKSPSIARSIDSIGSDGEDGGLWNDLSEYYACDYYKVTSYDGIEVPLTIVYSKQNNNVGKSPGLLHGHGAYGELLEKRWRNELKSLLDRGWVIAYADVRGGGGGGKKWHHDGRCRNKLNSIKDYISCAEFLIARGIVQENKLAGWGYSAGGLMVASAINLNPNLFRAAVLKVPFLDPINTLLYPILPLTAADYDEFGYPGDVQDFQAMRQYSPYENIPKDVIYPAVLVASSFSTRFGVWEAAKWVARAREYTAYDPNRPILLNLTTDIVEENRYLHCKESALEIAFLLKVMDSS
ncbi:hypothetical protein Leryth_017343 [Lithospermum erythrorhizon]|nr:hypothetical protein Leryth_017343 [Lithospermum erythrorhizon]